jgi:hypothetical protein
LRVDDAGSGRIQPLTRPGSTSNWSEPLSAVEVLDCLIEDVGSGSLAEWAKTVRLHRSGPGSVTLDFGRAGAFRVRVESVDGGPVTSRSSTTGAPF